MRLLTSHESTLLLAALMRIFVALFWATDPNTGTSSSFLLGQNLKESSLLEIPHASNFTVQLALKAPLEADAQVRFYYARLDRMQFVKVFSLQSGFKLLVESLM